MNKKIIISSFIASLAAIIALSTFITIPLGFSVVPIVFQDMLAVLSGCILGSINGFLSTILFVFAGAIGLPVFSGGRGGVAHIAGPTGGFLLGYILASLVAGLILKIPTQLKKSQSKKFFIKVVLTTILSFIILYIPGILWFMHQSRASLKIAITVCLIPFIPGLFIKIILNTCLTLKLRPIIAQYLTETSDDNFFSDISASHKISKLISTKTSLHDSTTSHIQTSINAKLEVINISKVFTVLSNNEFSHTPSCSRIQDVSHAPSLSRIKGSSYAPNTSQNKNVPLAQNAALDDVSFVVEKGSCTIIGGANGSGKSVLMSIIAELSKPSSGKIKITDQDGKKAKAALIFQEADSQILGETVLEDAMFGAKNTSLSNEEAEKKVQEALQLVELSEKINYPTKFLSGGEKRRLAVAGVLVMNRPLIIFDEPYANLDYDGVKQVNNTIKLLKKQKKTILILMHDIEKCLALADQFIILHNGKKVFDGLAKDALKEDLSKWGIKNPAPQTKIEDLLWI